MNVKRERARAFTSRAEVREFVQYFKIAVKNVLYDQVISCEEKREGVMVEVAMQHNDSYNENIFTFVNNINTPEGGTHLTGFKNAITKTFNDYARTRKVTQRER